MQKNKSEVIVILDRSGSMDSVKSDIEGGFQTFIKKQKKEAGECFVSLYQFDSKYEMVFENRDIQEVKKIELVPRGNTALLDAIGRTINSVGERLANTAEKDRPETVIVLTLTDGEENASKEFSKTRIKEMIQHQTSKYNWHFVFVGANQDAILTGGDYGIARGLSLSFAANEYAIDNTFKILSSGVSCMRASNVAYSFSDNERKSAMVSDDNS